MTVAERLANYDPNLIAMCPSCGDNRPTVYVYSHAHDNLVCVMCKVRTGEKVWGRHRREATPAPC